MQSELEAQFLQIIRNDKWIMKLLRHAAELQLKEWAIAAGTIRSAVWDHLHGYNRKTPPSDIDFLFYDPINISSDFEKSIEEKMQRIFPDIRWEAVNQATVHNYTKEKPYRSIEQAISRWAETATAIGVHLDNNGELKYYAPHGLDDLMAMIFRPNLVTPNSKEVYLQRIANKNFKEKWPKITILMP